MITVTNLIKAFDQQSNENSIKEMKINSRWNDKDMVVIEIEGIAGGMT